MFSNLPSYTPTTIPRIAKLYKKEVHEYKSKEGRRSFLLRKYKHHCSECGIKKWAGKLIPIEVHHKDGNNKNNIESNLQILCPNCHSLTDSWKRKLKEKKN